MSCSVSMQDLPCIKSLQDLSLVLKVHLVSFMLYISRADQLKLTEKKKSCWISFLTSGQNWMISTMAETKNYLLQGRKQSSSVTFWNCWCLGWECFGAFLMTVLIWDLHQVPLKAGVQKSFKLNYSEMRCAYSYLTPFFTSNRCTGTQVLT